MYRAVASRRQSSHPLSGLLGVRGAIGAIYSVHAFPTYSCNSPESREKATKSCRALIAKGIRLSSSRGRANYPNSFNNPYEIKTSQVEPWVDSEFDPCAVQNLALCPAPPRPTPPQPPPQKPPPAAPPPPSQSIPEDPVVIAQQPEPDQPVEVFEEPPEEVFEEPPEEEKDQLYVIGGIAALVLGGGLAYYLVTRKRKRRR